MIFKKKLLHESYNYLNSSHKNWIWFRFHTFLAIRLKLKFIQMKKATIVFFFFCLPEEESFSFAYSIWRVWF